MTFVTDSGYEMRPTLDYTPQFLEYNDVGFGSEYWKIVRDITNLRLNKYELTYKDLFGKPNQSVQDFLKRLAHIGFKVKLGSLRLSRNWY